MWRLLPTKTLLGMMFDISADLRVARGVQLFIGVTQVDVRKARLASNTLLYFECFGDNANASRDFTA